MPSRRTRSHHLPASVLGLSLLAVGPGAMADPPALPPLDSRTRETLTTQPSMFVRSFRFEGNTVFTSDELARVVAPFTNRDLTAEQLEEARRALTVHYVDHGYINSGAILPDQAPAEGVVTFQIVEGRLSDVHIQGNQRLRAKFVRDRIVRDPQAPLNVVQLKDRLELVRQNPNIERINAELKPGAAPGESVLDVRMKENIPWQLGLEFDNRRSPSVGAERFTLHGFDQNVTGNSDILGLRWGFTRGGVEDIAFNDLDDVSINYALPLNASDTTLILDYTRTDAPIVEAPFDELDISSESDSYSLTLRQPLYRSPATEFALFATASQRHNQTRLGGDPFSFSPGAQEGETNVTPLRFGLEWGTRNMTRAISLRSTFTVGVDALDATLNDDGPDGRYFAWLGQFQYVTRLGASDTQLVFRTAVQATPDPLLSLEQIGIGGMETVRGYRENQLIRDNAAISSIELRIPLLHKAGRSIVDLAPFFDVGYGWNATDPVDSELLSSAGLGLLVNPGRHFAGRIYWGYPLNEMDTPGGDLQDAGIHFDLVWWAF